MAIEILILHCSAHEVGPGQLHSSVFDIDVMHLVGGAGRPIDTCALAGPVIWCFSVAEQKTA